MEGTFFNIPPRLASENQGEGVFDFAGIAKGLSNAVSQTLRDTFAVELLLAGVPIERLSMLLGHQSIRVTEKHYAPWTRSRQEQIESDLTAAWKTDPMLSKKAGTKGVQIQKGHSGGESGI